MATWPRTIKRGPLKGEKYESEYVYRQALAAHYRRPSRYAERVARAKRKGYRSYAEQRKVRAQAKRLGMPTEKAEQLYLKAREHGSDVVWQIAEREARLFDDSTRDIRSTRVRRDLDKYGADILGDNAGYVWGALYDEMGYGRVRHVGR